MLLQVPFLANFVPRQRKALEAVALIRATTEELIAKCRAMVDAEKQVSLPAGQDTDVDRGLEWQTDNLRAAARAASSSMLVALRVLHDGVCCIITAPTDAAASTRSAAGQVCGNRFRASDCGICNLNQGQAAQICKALQPAASIGCPCSPAQMHGLSNAPRSASARTFTTLLIFFFSLDLPTFLQPTTSLPCPRPAPSASANTHRLSCSHLAGVL